MKIAMVSAHASPLAAPGEADAGGQNVHVAELSAALTRAGHDVTVHTRRESPDAPAEVTAPPGYRVVHVPAGPPRKEPRDRLLSAMGEFGGFLRDRWALDRPDLAHAHFWTSGLAATLAASATGVPVAQTFHALGVAEKRHRGEQDTSPAERSRLERIIGRQAARVLATCSDEVFELSRLGVPRDRISVVPCGVDLTRFTPGGPIARRRAAHRLVCVGRLVPHKGFDTVITALAQLPDTELVIAGGPERQRLSRDPEARRLGNLAHRLGVGERVRLLGQVSRDDLPALLRSADAVVCTPSYEPFGIVALEAMACGVPVVAAAVGGLTDTVVDGVTGLLVRPAELAPRLRRLLDDPGLRQQYGTAGLDRAQVRYSADRVAADTLRVYRQLVPDQVPTALRKGGGDDVLIRATRPHRPTPTPFG
jgi:glycosyltransferase involved in cell wall biosynthesis